MFVIRAEPILQRSPYVFQATALKCRSISSFILEHSVAEGQFPTLRPESRLKVREIEPNRPFNEHNEATKRQS